MGILAELVISVMGILVDEYFLESDSQYSS